MCVFQGFLNCTNDTKSPNISHIKKPGNVKKLLLPSSGTATFPSRIYKDPHLPCSPPFAFCKSKLSFLLLMKTWPVYLPGYQQGKPNLCSVVITLIFDYTNVFPENQNPILASLFATMKPLPSQGKRISHFFSGKAHKIYLPRLICVVLHDLVPLYNFKKAKS